MYTFLVLLGCFVSSGNVNILGTGFIIEYNNKLFVVSCKHVYHELSNKDSIFAIPNPKQTMSPKNGYDIIHLGKAYFHPNDNNNSTYDIVVFELLGYDKPTLLFKGINPLTSMSEHEIKYDDTNKLFAIGYPADYANNYLAKNIENKLPPKIVEGFLQEVNFEELSENGFTGKLKEGKCIRTIKDNRLGKGASGGLVFIKNESSSLIPIGMIVGSGDLERSYPNNTKENIHCIAYTMMERIIETLNQIH